MRFRLAFIPIVVAGTIAGYFAFHPGVAYAEPRIVGSATNSILETASYTIDKDHCSVYFEITHLGLSKVTGRFNSFSGKFHEDLSDLSKSNVEFSAQVDSIDTGVAARDAHLRTKDFFEVAKYPTLSFKSTKVARSGSGFVVTGDLTMKDKTKSISIPFKRFGPMTLTVGDKSTRVGIVAEPITLRRSDFGVGGPFKMPDGTPGVSDDLTVRISFEGTKDK